MTMIDMSGKPRSDEELQEARTAVGRALLNSLEIAKVNPELAINLTTIHQCLGELQTLRKLLEEARSKRLAGESDGI